MAPLTQCTWVWVDAGRERRAGTPGVLYSVRSQRLGCNLATEQQHQRYRINEINILYNRPEATVTLNIKFKQLSNIGQRIRPYVTS